MPYRTKNTLEAWTDEFLQLGYPRAGTIRVLDHDSDDDGGLVIVELSNAATATYLEPQKEGDSTWVVTMDTDGQTLSLDAAGLQLHAVELSTVAALCAYLEAKAKSHPHEVPGG